MLIHMVYPTDPKDEMLNMTRQDMTSPDPDFTLFLHEELRPPISLLASAEDVCFIPENPSRTPFLHNPFLNGSKIDNLR